jgi:hypothetical protein
MDAGDFEVTIGAMEYSTELTALCSAFCDRLNVVTLCSARRVRAVGQVVDYGNNQEGDVGLVELRPYHEHLPALRIGRNCLMSHRRAH